MRKRINLTREGLIADVPLREFFVWWDELTLDDVESLERRIESATREQDLQSYLEENPQILIQHLGGGHGRWVIPRKRLGVEHVTDFIIGHKNSLGFEWTGVELESSTAVPFTKAGDPTKALSHAIRQIEDWRSWLKKNQSYAARPQTESGLGLTDIDPLLPGLILIGRERDLDPATRERRRQLGGDLRIHIHTYDWLIREIRGRVEAVATSRTRPRSASAKGRS